MSPKETGMYLDWTDFDKKFYNLVNNAIPEDAEKGLVDGMNELLRDSIELPPQAPKDIGDLWGSTADTVKLAKEKGKLLGVSGGFNIKYARRHHEAEPGEFKYTVDKGASKPGPKFMQSKMAQFGKKYMEIVADSIRRRGK
jgi:hypothetical protein